MGEYAKTMVEELSTVAIPNSVQEALKDPRWGKAIQEEMDSLKKNWTWDEVFLPPGKKTCWMQIDIYYKARFL